MFISRLGLEHAFRARKRGRAMGDSGVPGELFALALAQVASMFFSLFSKATIYVQEPLSVQRFCSDCMDEIAGFSQSHRYWPLHLYG